MLKLIQKIIFLEIWSKPDIAVHKSRGSDLLDFLNVYDMLYVDANGLLKNIYIHTGILSILSIQL